MIRPLNDEVNKHCKWYCATSRPFLRNIISSRSLMSFQRNRSHPYCLFNSWTGECLMSDLVLFYTIRTKHIHFVQIKTWNNSENKEWLGYRMDNKGKIFVQHDFSLYHNIQTNCWAHPASNQWTQGFMPQLKNDQYMKLTTHFNLMLMLRMEAALSHSGA